MPFVEAQDLLCLAQMAACWRGSVSTEDICPEFDVSHRAAQRMAGALDATIPNVKALNDSRGWSYWWPEAPFPNRLQSRQDNAIETLEVAARTAQGREHIHNYWTLEERQDELRDGLLARLPQRNAVRSEVDADAVLAGFGQVVRPDPTDALKPLVAAAATAVLRVPLRLRLRYRAKGSARRVLEELQELVRK